MTALGVRVNEVNNEADKMIKAGHPQARQIRAKKQHLNDRWESMQQLKELKDTALSQAQGYVSTLFIISGIASCVYLCLCVGDWV